MTLLDIELRTASGESTTLAEHIDRPTVVVFVRYYG